MWQVGVREHVITAQPSCHRLAITTEAAAAIIPTIDDDNAYDLVRFNQPVTIPVTKFITHVALCDSQIHPAQTVSANC